MSKILSADPPATEMRLLVALCADDQPTCDRIAEISELITVDLDWNQVFVLSLWHKVAFLAYDHLVGWGLADHALSRGSLPLLLLNHWKQLHAINTLRNGRLLEELRGIVGRFEEHKVPFCVGKGGPLLIGSCYSASQRKMYDLDLLAPRETFGVATDVMYEAGYTMGTYSHDRRTVDPATRDELRRWLLLARGLPNFIKVTGLPELEVAVVQIQFKVGSTGRSAVNVPAERLLENAVRTDIRGSVPFEAPAPQPVDVLVQLALHIAREILDPEHADWGMGWNLIKFCDLARYVAQCDVSPAELAARASDLGFRDLCGYALTVSGLVYPSAVLSDMAAACTPQADSSGGDLLSNFSEADAISTLARLAGPRGRGGSEWTSIMGRKLS